MADYRMANSLFINSNINRKLSIYLESFLFILDSDIKTSFAPIRFHSC